MRKDTRKLCNNMELNLILFAKQNEQEVVLMSRGLYSVPHIKQIFFLVYASFYRNKTEFDRV